MPRLAERSPRHAVIDIGSNTTTLAVYEVSATGAVDRILQRGDPLRLLRAVGPDRMLSPGAIEGTVQLLQQFARIAKHAGVPKPICLATSAVRDARNGAALIARIRTELGIAAELLSEEDEGLAAATSVVNQLPVADGCMVDLGGGSLQVVELRDRRAVAAVSLPLGALRSTDAFFKSDPPSGAEVTALRRQVEADLRRACGWARGRGVLVGVGGTARAFAKVHRRQVAATLQHSHGYRLERDSLEAIFEHTSRLPIERRREVAGLSPHRVDLMPAGALTILTVMRQFGYEDLLVSHYGVREGVALRQVHTAHEPLLADVRESGLTVRFPQLASHDATRFRGLASGLVVELGLEDPMELAPVIARLFSLGTHKFVVGHLIKEPLAGFVQAEVLAMIAALDVSGEREALRLVAEATCAVVEGGFTGACVMDAPCLPPALRVRLAALRKGPSLGRAN